MIAEPVVEGNLEALTEFPIEVAHAGLQTDVTGVYGEARPGGKGVHLINQSLKRSLASFVMGKMQVSELNETDR